MSEIRSPMPEIRDQLHAYIDGIASPVTTDEITAAPGAARSFRSRPVLALAAGAAIVLVPAALLFGLWLWLGGNGGGTPAASTATSTTTSTTVPATTVPVVTFAAPDVVGLGVYEAQSVLTGAGLEWTVTNTAVDELRAGAVVAQDPAAGARVADGSVVVIDVATVALCHEQGAAQDDGLAVAFNCGTGSFYPDPVPVGRPLPAGDDPIEATLRALLAGPTDDERAAGFGSFFGPDTAGALRSVTVDGGTAVVDFTDAIYVNNASTSTGSMYFLAELEANVFRFPEVDRVEFRVNGSCVDFWTFLQVGECVVVDRGAWELEQARTALFDYFELLRQGSYLLAADRYGGDYTVLQDWNPDVDPADLYTLWKQGCTVNGLNCLRASEATLVDRAGGVFSFEVTFETADGQPFPATGSTYDVRADESGRYRVMELPPYTP